MTSLSATLSVQLACQLICAGNNNLSHLNLDKPVSKVPAVVPDGYTYFSDVGVAYKYYNSSVVTWNAARKACIAHDSNLAVIDSFKKVYYIHSLTGNPHNAGIFLGIHRLFGTGEWVSVKTGLPVQVVPWAPGQSLEENKENNCLALWHDGRGISAIPCTEKRHFVCEVSVDQN